jgi:hypothetical protein
MSIPSNKTVASNVPGDPEEGEEGVEPGGEDISGADSNKIVPPLHYHDFHA